MADAFGYRGSIGFAEESTWGTAVARTKFMEVINAKVDKKIDYQEAPSTRSLSERRRQAFGIMVDPTLEMEVIYEGLEKLFKHLFGAVATSGPTDTTVYTHQFTLADALPVGLSLEVFMGDDANGEAAGADAAHLIAGCKIDKATFSLKPNSPLTVALTLAGKDESFVALTTVTFPDLSGALLVKGHNITAELDDVATSIDEAEITIENGLDVGKRVMGLQTRAQPVRNTRRKVTGKFTADWVDKTLYNKFVNGTAIKLELIALSTTNIAGSASTKYQFAFTFPKIQLLGETPSLDGPGILKQPVSFVALSTGTGTSDCVYLDMKNALTAV